MFNNTISATALCALFSSTELAGDITIDLNVGTTSITPAGTGAAIIDQVHLNGGDITALIDGLDVDNPMDLKISLTDTPSGSTYEQSRHRVTAMAGGNLNIDEDGVITGNNLNMIDIGDSSLDTAEALIANYDYNDGTINSTVQNVDMSMEVSGTIVDSTFSIEGIEVLAFAGGNGLDNIIYGDFSVLDPIPTATTEGSSSSYTPGSEITELKAGGNFVIASAQDNQGDVTSLVDSVDMSFTGALDELSTVAVQGVSVGSVAFGNSVNNQIDGFNGGADNSFVIASAQVNTGAITATVRSVNLSITDTGSGGAGVSSARHSITASAVGNSSTNIIRLK